MVACIRSDTRQRGRVVKSQESVRGIPGSTPEIKISRFHHFLSHSHQQNLSLLRNQGLLCVAVAVTVAAAGDVAVMVLI